MFRFREREDSAELYLQSRLGEFDSLRTGDKLSSENGLLAGIICGSNE